MALQKKLSLYQGKTWVIKIQCLGNGGVPIDLTTYTFKFVVKSRPSLSEPYLFTIDDATGITVTDAAAGKVDIEVSADVTRGLPKGTHSYELVAYNQGKSKNLMVGDLVVLPGITV